MFDSCKSACCQPCHLHFWSLTCAQGRGKAEDIKGWFVLDPSLLLQLGSSQTWASRSICRSVHIKFGVSVHLDLRRAMRLHPKAWPTWLIKTEILSFSREEITAFGKILQCSLTLTLKKLHATSNLNSFSCSVQPSHLVKLLFASLKHLLILFLSL